MKIRINIYGSDYIRWIQSKFRVGRNFLAKKKGIFFPPAFPINESPSIRLIGDLLIFQHAEVEDGGAGDAGEHGVPGVPRAAP